MTNNERVDLTCRHELEIQRVVDLANVVGMYHNKHFVPDVIEEDDFFYEVSDSKAYTHPSLSPLSEFVSALLNDGRGNEEILDHLTTSPSAKPLMGIYLQVATPNIDEKDCFSWGYCRLMWVFGNTYEEAFKVACEWAKEMGHDYD